MRQGRGSPAKGADRTIDLPALSVTCADLVSNNTPTLTLNPGLPNATLAMSLLGYL